MGDNKYGSDIRLMERGGNKRRTCLSGLEMKTEMTKIHVIKWSKAASLTLNISNI